MIRVNQYESFREEIKFLQAPPSERSAVPPLVNQFNLFLDDKGLIRSQGRIENAEFLEYSVKFPLLLGKTHHITKLLVHDSHIKMQHLGVGSTLSCLRNRGYWIPKGRQCVRSVIAPCVTCKKFNALPYRPPAFPPKPKYVLDLVRPYQHVGIDFTGHLYIQSERGNVKMFLLVFTCLNVRAVHIELLPDMSTHHFLMAFMRFCNLYTIPRYIYSDNARTFIQGGRVLQHALASQEFEAKLVELNIVHVRIPLFAPHFGALWERMIRTIKSCLYKVVGKSLLNYFEMLTIISNIQFAINNRPLTYQCADQLEVITPNNFLNLNRGDALHLDVDDEEIGVDSRQREKLVQSLSALQKKFASLKAEWYQSYLLSLREQGNRLFQPDWTNVIKVGEVVLIKHPVKHRPFWSLGRVEELLPGSDEKVRVVRLKLGNGQIVVHPISHLYPLELSVTPPAFNPVEEADEPQCVDNTGEKASDDDDDRTSIPNRKERPPRKAAIAFREFVRQNLDRL